MLYIYSSKQLSSLRSHSLIARLVWLLFLLLGPITSVQLLAQQLGSSVPRANWGNSMQFTLPAPSCGAISDAHLQLVLDEGENHMKDGNLYSTQVGVSIAYSTNAIEPATTLKIQQNQPEARALLNLRNVNQAVTITVTITSLNDTGTLTLATSAKQRIRLIANPEINFAQTVIACVPTSGTQGNSHTFDHALYWTTTCSAVTTYQLQVVHRPLTDATPVVADEDYDTQGLLIETGPLVIVPGTTSKYTYQLALAQGAGTYFWRVRALGNAPGGVANPANWGDWSSANSFSQISILENADPEYNRNWIYSRTFTEGGRVAEKLTFANGLQQVRQTQTRLSIAGLNGATAQRRLLATQVLQDYSGRDAVTSLPIPLTDDYLHYVNTLLGNTSTAGGAYGPAHFDGDAVAREPQSASQPGELPNGNHYYSGSNGGLNTDARVPDAQGYPFTRTLFTSDGTNRVAEQSGVGAVMKIRPADSGLDGAPRTVRTFHMGATPEELYRVFGAESPDPKGVHKILTLDPNNTPSVTYQTKEGQTIATALSVVSAADTARLRHLPSAGSTFNVKERITGSSRVISKTITVTAQPTQAVDLDYSTLPARLGDDCVNYCSTCDYSVKVRVVQVSPIPADGKMLVQEFPAIDVINSASCTAAAPPPLHKPLSLAPGTYRIEREIIPYGSQAAATSPAGGRTLADHLALIRVGLDATNAASPWSNINKFLDDADITGLYAYLDGHGFSTITEGNNEYYLINSTAANCTSIIRLPRLHDYCGPVCDPSALANGAYEKLDAAIGALNDAFPNSVQQVNVVIPDYDQSQLQKLLENMIRSGYDCTKLQNCFDAEIAGVETNFYQVLNAPAGYHYDFIKSFFQCTGVIMQDVVFAPQVPDPTQAFQQLFVDPFNLQHVQCVRSALLQLDPNADISQFDPRNQPDPKLPDYTSAVADAIDKIRGLDKKGTALNDLYICLNSSAPYNPTAADGKSTANEAAQEISRKCMQACEDRRAEFQDAIITQFHLQGIAVQGDTYLYTTASTGATQPILSDQEVNSSTQFVETCQVQLLAQELINNCGLSCTVSAYDAGNGNWAAGTPTELHAVELAMTHGFDLSVRDLNAGGTATCTGNQLPVRKISGNVLDTGGLTPGALAIMNSVSALARNVNRLRTRPNASTALGCRLPGEIGEKVQDRFFHTAQVDETSWPSDPVCPAPVLPSGATYGVTVVDTRESASQTWHPQDWNYNTDYLLDLQTAPYGGCSRPANSNGPSTTCGGQIFAESNNQADDPYYRIRFIGENVLEKANIIEISPPFINYPFPAGTKYPYEVTSEDVFVRIRMFKPSDQTEYWVTAKVDAKGYWEGSVHSERIYPLKWKDVSQCTVKDNSRYAMCFAWHTQLDTVMVPSDSVGVFSGPENCNIAAARRIRNAVTANQQAWVQGHLDAFEADYNRKCVALENQQEDFTLSYDLGYYHYTLYYYDRAGNLLRTVPPKGVATLTATQVAGMLPVPAPAGSPAGTLPTPPPARSTWPLPNHTLVTNYTYNSLHQLVQQYTPDAGTTRFYYNAKGQLRYSQNAQQAIDGKYSYTRYDELGRVLEVGENPCVDANGSAVTMASIATHVQNMSWPTNGPAHDVTKTLYSTAASTLTYPSSGPTGYAGTPQRNLLNRVSYSWTDGDGDPNTTADNVYTYYSYDAHGNVEWLCQEMKGLPRKFVRYDYDLISNKVLRVNYQEGQADQLYHRYGYDGDNRLTEVYTSTDNVIWDQDARYQYYDHGPLKRLELGEDHVQGLDYNYTLQGWLKSINHPTASLDPGNDGTSVGVNASAQDAFSMALGYHEDDYVTTNAAWDGGGAGVLGPEHNLYNGNIASWTTQTPTGVLNGSNKPSEPIMGEQYRYDDLNRLVASQMYTKTGTGRNAFVATQNFKTLYAYDPNGNLQGLRRQGNTNIAGAPADMDYLTYTYTPGTNRLEKVVDDVPADTHYNDIKPVVNNNGRATYFGYNAIGNLVRDDVGKVSSITWNVYGKIATVATAGGGATSYRYDAAGNRVRKLFQPDQFATSPGPGTPGPGIPGPGTSTGASRGTATPKAAGGTETTNTQTDPGTGGGTIPDPQPVETGTAVYYVRDAQGNVLAVYEKALTGTSTTTAAPDLVEQPIYGSARLGERKTRGLALAVPTGGVYTRLVGQKRYELTDHLGNVRALVSDEPLALYNSGGAQVGFKPELLAYYNYYPFGMEQPGRVAPGNSTLADGYRFGFNGKEKDNNGELGLTNYDYGFRIYNPAYGRFLSIDPLTKTYPTLTPYQFAGNTPMQAIDLDGLEGYKTTDAVIFMGKSTATKTTISLDVYYIARNSNAGAMSSSYTKRDEPDIKQFLESEFNEAIDGMSKKDKARLGVYGDIEFKFNIQEYDASAKGGTENAIRNFQTISATKTDVPYQDSKPAIIAKQQKENLIGKSGKDNGITNWYIRVASDSDQSDSKTLGHEVLHYMLSLWAPLDNKGRFRPKEYAEHSLGGLMSNPPQTLNFNSVSTIIESLPSKGNNTTEVPIGPFSLPSTQE